MPDMPRDPRMPDMPRDPERTRGRYAFTLDGRPAGIDERFVLGEIAPGVWRVRTTRVSARPTSRVETDVRVDGIGTSLALRWTGSGDGVVRDASAELREADGVVIGVRTVEGRTSDEVSIPGRLNVVSHAVAGLLVPAAVGGVDVVEPDLLGTGDPSVLLEPRSVRWTTSRTGEEPVTVGGVEHAGTAYDWVDSGTGWTARMVVDAGGLLLRTRLAAPDGELEVLLVEVDGPWPEPLSWATAQLGLRATSVDTGE